MIMTEDLKTKDGPRKVIGGGKAGIDGYDTMCIDKPTKDTHELVLRLGCLQMLYNIFSTLDKKHQIMTK